MVTVRSVEPSSVASLTTSTRAFDNGDVGLEFRENATGMTSVVVLGRKQSLALASSILQVLEQTGGA